MEKASLAAWVMVLLLAAPSLGARPTQDTPVERAAPPPPTLAPLFEENIGQTDASVAFIARGGGQTLFLTPTSIVSVLHARRAPSGDAEGTSQTAPDSAVRVTFEGAQAVKPRGIDPLPTRSNYLIGNDPTRWVTDARHFASVRYDSIYPGIDVVFHEASGGGTEYDFHVAPGADATAIRLGIAGADDAAIAPDGSLVITVGDSSLVQKAPTAWTQTPGGLRIPVATSFVLSGPREARFIVGPHDPALALVIDPVLASSTYLGGSGNDIIEAVTADSAGNAFVTGASASLDFPTTTGARVLMGTSDVFVAKVDPTTGQLGFATFVGGGKDETGYGIALAPDGGIVIVGSTNSTDFPTASPTQSALSGPQDSFVTKLSATGNAISRSTYLGGAAYDEARGVAIDSSGGIVVAGSTNSTDYPVLSGYQSTNHGAYDAYVTRFTSGGALQASTFLGGLKKDYARALTLDTSGNVYVAGYTKSLDLPTLSAYQSTNAGGDDGFVASFAPSLATLRYSTYLGGTLTDTARGIATDPAGNAYVTGHTNSTNFPTLSAAQPTIAGTFDGFVAKLSSTGSTLLYSTFLGGAADDNLRNVLVDAGGNATVVGHSNSTNYPMRAPEQATNKGTYDAVITTLAASGSSILYSTYFGGTADDNARDAVLEGDQLIVVGRTNSTDFTTTAGASQRSSKGLDDAFVARIDLRPKAPIVTASAGPGRGQITLSWDASSDATVTGYRVYRGPTPGSEVALVDTTATTLTDSGLADGATQYYQVIALGIAPSPRSVEASAITFSLPGPPTAPLATSGPALGQVTLSWRAPASNGGSAVTGYRVYAGSSSGTEVFVALTGATTLTYSESGFAAGATRCYLVAALNVVGEGANSTETCGSAPRLPGAPAAPLTSSGLRRGEITVAWTAPSDTGGVAITSYKLYRNGTFLAEVPRSPTGFVDTGIADGDVRTYAVSAVNVAGEGPRSPETQGRAPWTPSAPLNVRSRPTSPTTDGLVKGIVIGWEAPTNTGGVALRSFTLTISSASQTRVIVLQSAFTRYLYEPPLTDSDHAYSVTVTATNVVGDSPASAPTCALAFPFNLLPAALTRQC